MSREAILGRISDSLGGRLLIWAGIRGSDAESLSDLEQFAASFTIIDRYTRRPLAHSVAHEDSSGRRVDLETWDIDDHLEQDASLEFRRGLLRVMAAPCALVPYRPSRFLSSLWFARQDRCLNLGLFGAHQSAFEHKPWVESSLRRAGVPGLDWVYVADEEQLAARDFLRHGPIVLRRSRSSGGEGMAKVSSSDELVQQWPHDVESFVSVSRYVHDGMPVNVGGTVWSDGVTVHHASVQLIGIRACGQRPFGYCGNDFAAAAELPDIILDQIEDRTRRIGRWLGGYGYRGTFGVDFLVKDGQALFTEVNPRFQGSSAASSRLSVEAGQPCLLLEHVAASLGVSVQRRPPLRTQVREARPLAQVVVHSKGSRPAHLDTSMLADSLRAVEAGVQAEALAPASVQVEPSAVVGRFVARRRLTWSGYDLDTGWERVIDGWQTSQGASKEGKS